MGQGNSHVISIKTETEILRQINPNSTGRSGQGRRMVEVNSLIGSWVLNTIDSTLRNSINYSERVNEVWSDIRERFMVGNGPQKYELKITLANCKQGADSVSVYHSKLNKIWEELENCQQYLGCDSGGHFSNSSAITKEWEEENVYQFLMGLNDTVYGTI